MIKMLTQWRESKNLLKYLLILFIILIAFIEGTRLFIHNITTKLGWWMWITGVFMTTVFFTLAIYNDAQFIQELMKFIEYLEGVLQAL